MFGNIFAETGVDICIAHRSSRSWQSDESRLKNGSYEQFQPHTAGDQESFFGSIFHANNKLRRGYVNKLPHDLQRYAVGLHVFRINLKHGDIVLTQDIMTILLGL